MMSTGALVLATLSLLVWLYLLLGRSGFWRAQPRLDGPPGPAPAAWPAVVAIIPARNEAASIAAAVTSLLHQDYEGELSVIVVDDHSEDATAAIARDLEVPPNRTLRVVSAEKLQPGWSGKLWALAQGLRQADVLVPEAPYLLLTDADIAHDPHNLARLVGKAVAEERDLVSLMVKLRCQSFWERLLIPPFVFFFQMLYPFPAVNRRDDRMAAAAGGCMLIRRTALRAAGGIDAIRDRLIDDVALGQLIKHRSGGGDIWLGLTAQTASLRPYDGLGALWAMVARTADVQLRHSLLLLIGTLAGLVMVYIAPPLWFLTWPLHGDPVVGFMGGCAWAAMTLAFLPTLRLYGLTWPWSLTLPLAAGLYGAMTLDSAIRHRFGHGGAWRGRPLRQ